MYVDYKLDESYTPSRIAVRAGTNHHDLTVSGLLLSITCTAGVQGLSLSLSIVVV